ncbi:hypothetical protein CcrColossus_gp184 [Caulobacter phage CcrColossus]|uniref:Uncharacterized protein n=1 Tax=Caulobacter phage CcrColossus TaxID=1211640 RepID=K4JRU7_9CAUD|nr:hypothetical protein CcrColossus_gp184 [Caulobacter phage CcrColossus]AFU88054.1 hypothetical protein CcrColossus_gp184 [Caulobacter phage CcrColossus]
MGMASYNGMEGSSTLLPDPEQPSEPRRRGGKTKTPWGQSKHRRGKQKTLEEQFAAEIKAGLIKIVRRRGKPPEIVFL